MCLSVWFGDLCGFADADSSLGRPMHAIDNANALVAYQDEERLLSQTKIPMSKNKPCHPVLCKR